MKLKDELEKFKNSMIGRAIKIGHPISPANPSEINEIVGIKFDGDKCYIIGIDTCWFEANMAELIDE